MAHFDEQGVPTQMLNVSHAFHSPLMDEMLDDFESYATGITYSRPTIPIVINRTGKLAEGSSLNAQYWRDHLRNCVEFSSSMTELAKMDIHAFVEVGPSASLLGMGRRCIPDHDAAWLPSLRKGKDDWNILLAGVAELYRLGFKLDWQQFDAPWPRTRAVIPGYPFQRQRSWLVDGRKMIRPGASIGSGPAVHPLLGSEIASAVESTLYRVRLSLRSPKYLVDHQVQGSVIVPAAAYIEQGLAAAQLAFGTGRHGIEDLAIQQPMFLPAEGARDVELVVAPENGGRSTFETYSISAENADPKSAWTMHASGAAVHEDAVGDEEAIKCIQLDEIRQRMDREIASVDSYKLMAERGLEYGPCFQGLGKLDRGIRESLGQVSLHPSVEQELEKYQLHPALGDALLQSIAGTVPPEEEASGASFLPIGVRRVRVLGELTDDMLAYAARTTEMSDSPDQIQADVRLVDSNGRVLAELIGVVLQRMARTVDTELPEQITDWMYQVEWQPQTLTKNARSTLTGTFLVFIEDDESETALTQAIQSAGGRAVRVQAGEQFLRRGKDSFTIRRTVGEDYEQLMNEALGAEDPECSAMIHAWGLNPIPLETSEDGLAELRRRGVGSALPLFQRAARHGFKKPPQVWLTTRQALATDDHEKTIPAHSLLWGLGRVAALEHPELRCRLIDFSTSTSADAFANDLIAEISAGPDEDQIAYRNGNRLVAGRGLTLPMDGSFQLRIMRAGSMDSLEYVSFELPDPLEGQIQVEIHAAGLNFSDVLKAMGLYPGIKDAIVPLGIECAGTVTAVGPGVNRFRVGDPVMGVAPYSFGSHTVTADYAMVHKPATLNDEEACTIPITFLTAYYAFCRLANLQRGERVLIHAGAGGVGLAAIQIAKQIGAEIFATAGSDEKRDHLRQFGVDHVMNSRTLDFAGEILEITNREGVDVVLNSLPGAAIAKSLSCLKAYGRFLEIGKIDIYKNSMIGLLPFQDNLSYFAIDLDRLLRQRPDYIREMFAELMEIFADGTYQALPYTQFAAEQTVESFRYMAGRKNIGKVVVALAKNRHIQDGGDEIEPLASRDGTYLVTGGLGALGLQVGHWLVKQGAGHLALMGRSQPADKASEAIEAIRQAGAKVTAVQADVTDRASLDKALASLPDGFPPLKGVIHAAGVLADGVMFDMTAEQLAKPLGPKVDGTWHLHEATRDQPLDFFVLFSSVACVLGSPGQANYAAGNLFLDSMAAYRRSQGLPAVSINWGPWADSGMAAEAGRDNQLEGRGMGLLPSNKAFEVLGMILRHPQGQPVVMSVRWQDMLKAGGGAVPPLLRVVAPDAATTRVDSAEDRAFRGKLAEQTVEERLHTLQEFFTDELASIMAMEVEDIDISVPLSNMGLDSLLAIELKNKIEGRLKVVLPMALFMQEPSINMLAEHVAENYGESSTEGQAATSPSGNGKNGKVDTQPELVTDQA